MRNQTEKFNCYKEKKIAMLTGEKKLPGSKIRKVVRPLLRSVLSVQRKINGFSIEILNEIKIPEGRSVIFALTHIGKWDFEIVNEQIKSQFFVIASDFIHMHGNVNGLFMNLNGVIFVDETSREDKANTKGLMIRLLQAGKNIMILPEGTWNLSENEIVRDIAYGAADAAISANAVILPIAIEQYEKRFVIYPGEAINPDRLQADKQGLTNILRDELASLKWKIWEKQGICRRSMLASDYWDRFIQERRLEWSGYSIEEQVINTYIPKKKWEYWQVQRDLKTGRLPLWYQILLCESNDICRNDTDQD